MIKITSFYPFNGFLRINQEFYEDKFIVKTKSFTFEHEVEYPYSKVIKISDSYNSSGSQKFFGFWLLVLTGFGLSIFYNEVSGYPVLIRITQILFVVGLLLCGTSLIKSRYIFFSDKDNNVLTSIKQTRRNREEIIQVIEMIKAKAENIQEIRTTDPFPKSDPVFEHIYYDYSKLEKTIDRFYENEIIGLQNDLFTEKVYLVKYDELSGKLFRGKFGNKIWGPVLSIMTFVIAIMFLLSRAFSILPMAVFIYTSYTLAIILLLSWLLSFVKRETIGFYSKDGRLRYWAFINRTNKEKYEKIVDFVISKIPDANKETHLKEQA